MSDTAERVERESKLLYKNNASKFLFQKTHLRKQTDYLNKWHTISERDIGRQEDQMRKNLAKLELEKEKYKKAASTQEVQQTDDVYTSQNKLGLGVSDLTDARAKSFHSRPKSGKRDTLDSFQPRSVLDLKKASSTSIASDTTNTPDEARDFIKRERSRIEAQKVNEKCQAYLKNEDFKAHSHRRSLTEGKSGTAVPLLLVTDDQGVSEVATREDETLAAATGSTKFLKASWKSADKTSCPPSSEQLDTFFTMTTAIANNPDEFASGSNQSKPQGRKSQTNIPSKQVIDLAKLKEVEELLYESSQFRKKQKGGLADSHSSRVQQRRLDRLKEILDSLKKPEPKAFSPLEMLNCSYLRLSKSNVEELEEMVRAAGQDPGLHYHSDLTNYDLFAELQKEFEAQQLQLQMLKESEVERSKSQLSRSQMSVRASPSKRRQSIK